MPLLFEPLTLRGLELKNRAWLAPMCQYCVDRRDGVPTDWHLVHLGSRAAGGFGLVITEATAVTPEGRISPQDTGLWNDEQQQAWGRIVDFVHGQGAAIGVQLAHAGRKGSTWRRWPGQLHGTQPVAEGGWQTVGPSPVAYPGYAAPVALDPAGIERVVAQFAAATRRADEAGFDVVELHAAHGYLLHQFCSPLSNHRTDGYGGDFAGRTRIVVEVVDAVRRVWPDRKPLLVRLSATDWLDGGWDVEQTSALAKVLAGHGADLADISSGGVLPSPNIVPAPGYQAGFARLVRTASGVPTAAVGLITQPRQAEQHLAGGDADAILLGREALREPYWPLKAAHQLKQPGWVDLVPPQYVRAAPAYD